MSSSRTQNGDSHALRKLPMKLFRGSALMQISLLTLCCCFGPSIRAAGGSEPVLTARPGLCILKEKGNPICEMAVELIWNTALVDNVCLHSSVSADPLQCWRAAREGQYHFELSSPQGVEFWLQRPDSDTKLAKITLRIVSLSQRNPQRRRRRHVWSVL